MTDLKEQIIKTKNSGSLKCHIQGNLNSGHVVIVTVHDLGVNHKEFVKFSQQECMSALAQRCVWVHIDVPGQGENEDDLEPLYAFPSMEQLAEDILEVFDELSITQAVLFGDGSGANVLARFAMSHDDRVLGCVLVHCTGTTAGFLESFKDKMIGRKLSIGTMTPEAEKYLVAHRFGVYRDSKTDQEFKEIIRDFKQDLNSNINAKNLNRFLNAFMNRTDITGKINQLKCPVLFMTGSAASHNHTVHTLYNTLQKAVKDDPLRKTKIELVQINEVANVMCEKPEKVAESLQYFLQGLGMVSGYVNRRMSSVLLTANTTSAGSRVSMEDLDKPRRVSLSTA